MIVAAVPVKDLVNAKQRLLPLLTPEQRAALAQAMLRDVLAALTSARVDLVWVVTRDPGVAVIARALGADVLDETDNCGHTAAVARAQAEATRRGAARFLTLPGDVPCVSAAEIDALAGAADAPPAAVFAPSRSGLGTNGVALSPPATMPLRFGEPSFDNHLAAARARGLAPRVLTLRGLGLDIDAPDDLRALLTEGAHTASGRLVADWEQAGQLAGADAFAHGFERRRDRRNPDLGEVSEGAAEAPSD